MIFPEGERVGCEGRQLSLGNVCTKVLVVVTDLEALLSVEVGPEKIEALYIIGLKMNGLVFTCSRVVMEESE